MDERVKELRASMKSGFTGEPIESDQNKGVPAPQMMLFAKDDNYVRLPAPDEIKASGKSLLELVRSRRSRRKYSDKPLTKEQLSYLLFCTQGYEELRPGQLTYAALRTVPSAGCRHPFDTYLAIRNVEGIEPGFYRYLPRENGLELVKAVPADELEKLVNDNCLGQIFCGHAPVCFFWVADIYRSEWRYPGTAHKVVLLDAGHVCQNLYLACEELGLGTCGIGAYDQAGCDAMLGLDGVDVFTLYVAPVGIPG